MSPHTDSHHSPAGRIGLTFANALAAGDFAAAHRLLHPALGGRTSPDGLRAGFKQMTSYWTAPADEVRLRSVDDDGPDAAWVFVAIDSLACSGLEAVNLLAVRGPDGYLIADIVWGRP